MRPKPIRYRRVHLRKPQWAISLLAVLACVLALLFFRNYENPAGVKAAALRDQAWRGIPQAFQEAARPRYRYSVVAGGVRSRDEVLRAVASDKLVQAHYGGIQLRRLHLVPLNGPRAAFVSYRRDGRVFWTRRKIRLRVGEELLTDGEHLIRARCGNRISAVAMKPTAHNEPLPEEFDSPEVVTARLLLNPVGPGGSGPGAERPQRAPSEPSPTSFTAPGGGPTVVERTSVDRGSVYWTPSNEPANPEQSPWFPAAIAAPAVAVHPAAPATPVTPEPGAYLLLISGATAVAIRMRQR